MAKPRIHGVAIHAGLIEVASLEQRPERSTMARHDAAPCPSPPAENIRTLMADEAGPILQKLAPQLAGHCAVALSARRLLTRVVDLPSTDLDELDGMVELQVDQFSPYPVEQLIVSYEVLHQGLGTSRTLIAAARRDQVEQVGRLFREAGLRARWLDVDALGWWALLRDHAAGFDEGREILLLLESSETLLIVVQDGSPVLFRVLDGPELLPPEAFAEMVVEELDYALTSLETEWGGDVPRAIRLWHREDPPPGLENRLTSAFETAPARHSLADLPPLSQGIASRAGSRQPGMVDLAPVEWETAAQARQSQRRLLVATSALVLGWLVGLIGLSAAIGQRRAQLAELAARLEALESPAAEVRAMRQQTQFLDRYTDQTYSALENLRAISTVLPAGVDLNSMSYSKGGAVNLRGTADSRSPIFEFLRSMQDLGLYNDVKLGKVDLDQRSGKSVFRLTATMAEESESP